MIKEITIPEIGENVESGDVVDILVKKGEKVTTDQGIIELETDKAVVEIPSPEDGTIVEILVKVGDEVKIGEVIARLDTEGKAAVAAEKETALPTEPVKEKPPEKKIEIKPGSKTGVPAQPVAEKTASSEPVTEHVIAPAAPSVRRLARELGADINLVPGSGPGGRISAEDVKKYVKGVVTGAGVRPSAKPAAAPLPDFSRWGEIERQPLSRVRRITAQNTAYAWNTVPHVTQFDKADITELEKFRKKYGEEIKKRGGKLTVTALLLKILGEALKQFPRFNTSLDMDGGQIIFKKYYHIGIAVDTERGLLVPVIRDVDKKNIEQLAVELADISERTRNKKVTPDELEGGTFTISNQGGIGGTDFTPIVYWPQAAIIGVSRSSVQPVYIDGKFEPRVILPLSLSYDHRLIDGADAARFLKWVAEALEHPLVLCFEK